MQSPDTSTFDVKGLRVYSKPQSYEISRSMGMGCFLDAPGYPSHFLQSVYTRHGNTPRKGAEAVIKKGSLYFTVYSSDDWNGAKSWDDVQAKRDARLRKMWRPLPIDSERVQVWIMHVMAHFAHCYNDPSKPTGDKDRTVIWPMPKYQYPPDPRNIKNFGSFSAPVTWDELTPETQRKLLSARRGIIKARLQHAWNVAKYVDHHAAFQWIRKFYPDFQLAALDLLWIDEPPKVTQEDWIDIYATQPLPDQCPGHLGVPHGKYDYCRMCGREVSANADK